MKINSTDIKVIQMIDNIAACVPRWRTYLSLKSYHLQQVVCCSAKETVDASRKDKFNVEQIDLNASYFLIFLIIERRSLGQKWRLNINPS